MAAELTRAEQIVQAAEVFALRWHSPLFSGYESDDARNDLFAAVALPPDEREERMSRCICGSEDIEVVKKPDTHTSSDGVVVQYEDRYSHCKSCGNEFYTAVQSQSNTTRVLRAQITRLTAALREREADGARYRWLRDRLHGADFDYDTAQPRLSVLTFRIPDDTRVSGNLDETIDTARTTEGA